MPNWFSIEDGTTNPKPIWLSQEFPGIAAATKADVSKDVDKEDVKKEATKEVPDSTDPKAPPIVHSHEDWRPLRKVDCLELNKNPTKKVLIEGSRATADPVNGIVRYNFYRCAEKRLTSAVWFVQEEPMEGNQKKPKLRPLCKADENRVETFYNKAVNAAASFGDGLDTLFKEEIEMEDPNYCIRLSKIDGNLVMQKCAKGWFGKTFTLQRGYGAYIISGEEDELALGPVRNVIFVVHGIGEALWSRHTVNIKSSMDEINGVRQSLYRRQVREWKLLCKKAHAVNHPEPPAPNRTEFIPIQWYDRIHSSSNALMKSVRATTLNTIPALRAIANDCIFDVLMYLTPNFCHEVLECVTEQIHENYLEFQKCHPDFYSQKGKCSLIGHSLGSVICWDLLSILQEKSKLSSGFPSSGIQYAKNGEALEVVYRNFSFDDGSDLNQGSWGPSLSEPLTHCLPFVPEFTLFLGSPVGLFLTLRGAHSIFEELENIVEEESANQKVETKPTAEKMQVSPFTLPTGALYNIFHPSDPVAYRIEPLLLPQDTPTEDLPPPLYLTRLGQDVRLHVKAGQFAEELRKSIVESTTSLGYFMNMVSGQAQNVLKAIDRHANEIDDDYGKTAKKETPPPKPPLIFPLAGSSSKNRVDHQLQPRAIDNEYLTAVTAHGCYFSNEDFLDFLMEITQNAGPADDEAAKEVALSEAQKIFDTAAAQTAKEQEGTDFNKPIVIDP